MKKTLFLLLILPLFVFAELNIEKVNKTLLAIKSSKSLSFYTNNTKIKLKHNLKFSSFKNADIILFSKKVDRKKAMIVKSYKALKSNKNSIGAIYVRKGRTQIVFVKERLESYGLRLSPRFNKHLIYQWQLNKVALLNSFK